MKHWTTQVSLLREEEHVASQQYFLETGLDFYDLTYVEQKRRIEEEHNGY